MLIVRKALSGVARMSNRTADGWQGRFGKGTDRAGAARQPNARGARRAARPVSTYGLLRDAGVSYLNELFRELQAAGLIVQNRQVGFSGKEYQTMTLTAAGEQVMRGRTPCELSWPETSGSAERQHATPEKPARRRETHLC